MSLATKVTTVLRPNIWSDIHEPAAANKATKTKAAPGAGKRLVITSIHGTIACGATAQTPIRLQLSEGATVIRSWSVAAPANGMGGVSIEMDDNGLVLADNTAAKLEFSAAGVTDSVQSVAMGGYIAS